MPGPSMILVIMNTIEGGLKKGFLSILGVVVADAILLIIVLSGMGAIVASSATIFNLMKWCGAIYLIYMGIALLRSVSTTNETYSISVDKPFSSAMSMTMLNPKIIIFLIAFFPQFIDSLKSIGKQMWLLSTIFLAVVFTILAAYSLCALKLRNLFKSHRGMRSIKLATAISLIGCGTAIVL